MGRHPTYEHSPMGCHPTNEHSPAYLDSQQPSQTLPEEWARFYAAQIAIALGFLHSRRMLYLDLKLENVLLSAKGDATLVDFGFVRTDIDVGAGQVCATPSR